MTIALDDVIPAFHFRESHSTRVDATPEQTLAAARAATPAEMPIVRPLFALRSLGSRDGLPAAADAPLFDQLVGFGFALLGERPGEEVVFGLVDQAWKLRGGETVRVSGAEEFRAFSTPGYIKAAANFRAWSQGGWTLLETETRVLATDPVSRRKFGRYWLVIRPGSGLIRRSWLKAAKRRAERAPRMVDRHIRRAGNDSDTAPVHRPRS